MTFQLFLIAFLATYRVTLLLSREAGPGDIFGALRARVGVRVDEYSKEYSTGWLSEAVLCPYCLSVWIAGSVWLFVLVMAGAGRLDIAEIVLLPLALSGACVFCFKWGGV